MLEKGKMLKTYNNSKKHFQEAIKSIPAGVSSNSRVQKPHPIYFESAKGAELFDIDGNRFIDLNLGNGAVILGHGSSTAEGICGAVGTAVQYVELGLMENMRAELERLHNPTELKV